MRKDDVNIELDADLKLLMGLKAHNSKAIMLVLLVQVIRLLKEIKAKK